MGTSTGMPDMRITLSMSLPETIISISADCLLRSQRRWGIIRASGRHARTREGGTREGGTCVRAQDLVPARLALWPATVVLVGQCISRHRQRKRLVAQSSPLTHAVVHRQHCLWRRVWSILCTLRRARGVPVQLRHARPGTHAPEERRCP